MLNHFQFDKWSVVLINVLYLLSHYSQLPHEFAISIHLKGEETETEKSDLYVAREKCASY